LAAELENVLISDPSGTDLFDDIVLDAAGNFYVSSGAQIIKYSPSRQVLWAANVREAYEIALDGAGNIYATGPIFGTRSSGAPADNVSVTSNGGTDTYVVKLASDGHALWGKSLGGTQNDYPGGIAVDAAGNVFATGTFEQTATFGTHSLVSAGGDDVHVTRLSTTGQVEWARRLGGTSFEEASGVDVDPAGNAYFTGNFTSAATLSNSSITLTSAGSRDVFVAKVTASGDFSWARSMGGSSILDLGKSLAVDPAGFVVTVGEYGGPADFDPGPAVFNLPYLGTGSGGRDMYVSKLDLDGNFVWAKAIGGTGAEFPTQVVVGSQGNIYITGSFFETCDFDPSSDTYRVTASHSDPFAAALDADGELFAARAWGGSSLDVGVGIAVNPAGKVYVTGYFNALFSPADFDPGPGTHLLSSNGNQDGFIVELTPPTAAVGNMAWNDSNANGIQNLGEPGLAGALVELYYSHDPIQGNSDDSRVGSHTTDGTGNYLFDALASGNYYVTSQAPAGYNFTTPNAGSDDAADSDVSATGIGELFTLLPGQQDNTRDAGFVDPTPGLGDLDPSFGTQGKVTTEFVVNRASRDTVSDVAQSVDGKSVMVGEVFSGRGPIIGVARVLADGSLDPDFGNDGTVVTAISSQGDHAAAVAIQPDGKIVVGGYTSGVNSNLHIMVLRYLENGDLDPTFGNNGVVVTPIGSGHSRANDLLLQPDGKILVVGEGFFVGSDFALVRYLPSGQLDPDFGAQGICLLDLGFGGEAAEAVELTSDNKIIVVGSSTDDNSDFDAAVVRVHTNGAIDSSFGEQGIRRLAFANDPFSFGAYRRHLAVQADNKLLVSGPEIIDGDVVGMKLLRLTDGGSIDEDFGSGGAQIETTMIAVVGGGHPIALLDDGKILVGGRIGPHSGASELVVAQFLSGGSPDPSFADNGIAIHDLTANEFEQPEKILVDSSGRITAVMAGFSSDFTAARLLGNGSLDSAFAASGVSAVNFLATHSEAHFRDLALDRNDKPVAIGTSLSTIETFQTEAVLARYLSSGALDPTLSFDGRAEIALQFSQQAASVLPAFDGTLIAHGEHFGFTSQTFLAQLNPDGSPSGNFGTNGALFYDVDPNWTAVAGALLQQNRQVVSAGYTPLTRQGFVMRTGPDGQLDQLFGTGGIAQLPNPGSSRVHSLAVQADGRIVAVGESFPPAFGRIVMTIWRLNVDGSPDQGFGEDGVAFVADPAAFMYAYDVAVQRDGKLLLCGRFHTGANNDVAVVRLLSNGNPDASFGDQGIVRTDLSADDAANSLALFEDGRLVVAGSAIVNGNRDFLVLGYTSTGVLDAAFGAGGVVTVPFAGYDDRAETVRISKSGDVLVGGSVVMESALGFGLAKLRGDGVPQLPWHNYDNPLNVDQDPGNNVSPIDALLVINELIASGANPVPSPNPHAPPRFYHDVNADNFVSPIDALLVINHLINQSLTSPPSVEMAPIAHQQQSDDLSAAAAIAMLSAENPESDGGISKSFAAGDAPSEKIAMQITARRATSHYVFPATPSEHQTTSDDASNSGLSSSELEALDLLFQTEEMELLSSE
jgi:uncharacterized delta-60 repeat protein